DGGVRRASLARLAARHGRVRVVAHLGRQIERDGEPGLALLQEEAVALVRLGGGAEARVLAHGPEALSVHLRMDAAGEWKFSRLAQVAGQPLGRNVLRPVDRLQRTPPGRLDLSSRLPHTLAPPAAAARPDRFIDSPRLRLASTITAGGCRASWGGWRRAWYEAVRGPRTASPACRAARSPRRCSRARRPRTGSPASRGTRASCPRAGRPDSPPAPSHAGTGC